MTPLIKAEEHDTLILVQKKARDLPQQTPDTIVLRVKRNVRPHNR